MAAFCLIQPESWATGHSRWARDVPVFLLTSPQTISPDEKSSAFRPCKQNEEPSNKNTIHFGIIYEKA